MSVLQKELEVYDKKKVAIFILCFTRNQVVFDFIFAVLNNRLSVTC